MAIVNKLGLSLTLSLVFSVVACSDGGVESQDAGEQIKESVGSVEEEIKEGIETIEKDIEKGLEGIEKKLEDKE